MKESKPKRGRQMFAQSSEGVWEGSGFRVQTFGFGVFMRTLREES